MSEHFKDEPIAPAVTEQQVPHSGTLPESLREQPVRDFDNTTLPEAFERGHLVTPNSPAPLIEHPEPRKPKRGLLIGLGAAGAGVALAAGAAFGVNALGQAPSSEPTSAAPADPSETPSDVQRAPTPDAGGETEPLAVDKIEIPAGLDTQTLGNLLVGDRFNAWGNAGATDSLLQRVSDANQSWDEFLPTVVEHNEALFAEALFVPGWQSDPSLRQYVERSTQVNLNSLKAYVATAWNSDEVPGNKEGYLQWEEVQSVTEVPDADPNDASRTLDVVIITKDNSDQNTVESQLDGKSSTYAITVQDIDGKEKISAISFKH